MWLSERRLSWQDETKLYSEYTTQREQKSIIYYQIEAVGVSKQIHLWDTATKWMLIYDRLLIQW
jgi:hypothetical protein